MSNKVDSSCAASVVSTLFWEMDFDFECDEWFNLDASYLFSGIALNLTGWEKGSSFVVLPLFTVEVLNSDFTNDSLFELPADLIEVTSSHKKNFFNCLDRWEFDHGPVVKVVLSDLLSGHGETSLGGKFHLAPLMGPEGFEAVLGFQGVDGLWFLHFHSHLAP